jgi:Bcl-2 antagonist/killer family protein
LLTRWSFSSPRYRQEETLIVKKKTTFTKKMASGGGNTDESNPPDIPEEQEREVVRDTEGVFRTFVYRRFQEEIERGDDEVQFDAARSDALEELRSCNDDQRQHINRIGQRLGEVGDEIDAKYRDQFHEMIDQLSLTSDTAYETFASVTRRLFRSGINWGRIIALLCFGYEIAIAVIRRGFSGSFLRRIIRYLVDFIFRERIARWIAEHGGWVSTVVATIFLVSV